MRQSTILRLSGTRCHPCGGVCRVSRGQAAGSRAPTGAGDEEDRVHPSPAAVAPGTPGPAVQNSWSIAAATSPAASASSICADTAGSSPVSEEMPLSAVASSEVRP